MASSSSNLDSERVGVAHAAGTPRSEEATWSGRYSLRAPSGESPSVCGSDGVSCQQVTWCVVVTPCDKGTRGIKRAIIRDANPWPDLGETDWWKPEEVIWPAWSPADARSDAPVGTSSPLGSIDDYWTTAGGRLRDSAKWIATILGAALATLVGTSPLVWMHDHPLTGWSLASGVAGLIALAVTLVLVLQVLRPKATSYLEVQMAKPLPPLRNRDASPRGPRAWRYRYWLWRHPLSKWKDTVESQQDLYLPSGVKCLQTLRQMMIVDEVTLMALSNAMASPGSQRYIRALHDAETIRAARLQEWRTAASRIALIGEFYVVSYRSSRATYIGTLLGLIGTALIVWAFMLAR
jgi:hypothetical protein